MLSTHVFDFPPFRLDVHNAQLWRGAHQLAIRPKTFAVLCYLLEHAGQVVTSEELRRAVWQESYGQETAPKQCIRELRVILGDNASRPRFIETLERRGYRFIAPVTRQAPLAASASLTALGEPTSTAVPLVGREAELAQLHAWWQRALAGQRQVVFVAGEAGIGKTTVVDALLATITDEVPCGVAWGQCIAHYGEGEAYLPVLDALGRLCRAPGQAARVALLHRHAPTWVAQMPSLFSAAELAEVQRRVQGSSRERMLRELAEALEVMTMTHPLILVLEDLHWSDQATLDLLAWLARRREPARLLIVGTYRPVEVIVRAHSLRTVTQDLILHRQGVELSLDGLNATAVETYLTARCPGETLPVGLARILYQRTEGQPLFMVHTVDDWVQQGWLAEVAGQWELRVGMTVVETGIPENVRQMIGQHFDGLCAAEQALLETASVAGGVFSVAVVAAGVEASVEEVEAHCEALVRRGQFIQRHGVEEWPDGTVTGCYGFLHALYQQVVYDRLPVGRRAQLHRRIGARQETAYGQYASEHAAELAMHFDQGRDFPRALWYRQQAAENALRRYAYQETIGHARRGLEMLQYLQDTPERAQQELALHIALGPAFMATQGQAAPGVEQTYARARILCQQIGDTPQLFSTLGGLWRFYVARGVFATARELGEQLLSLAQHATKPALRLEAHVALGHTLFYLGDYATARAHFEQAIAVTEPRTPRTLGLRYGDAPEVRCLAITALTLWCLGYPAQALQQSQKAIALAQTSADPHSLAFAQYSAAYLHYHRRDVPLVQDQTEALLTLAATQGFPLWVEMGTFWRGWVLAMQGQGAEGLTHIQRCLAAVLAIGQTLARPYGLLLLAEVAGYAGQVEEGRRWLAEAIEAFEAGGRGDLLTEAYRLQGELLLQAADDMRQVAVPAEACFQRALATARQQRAKSWELRAALSLSRLWQRQGKYAEVHALLAPIYHWFTEGFDTRDLQDAQALLETCRTGNSHDPRR